MFDAIKQWIATDKPFLGICVGYQLLFEGSDESPQAEGLGIFQGKVVKFQQEAGIKIPHMGWNAIAPTQPDQWSRMSRQTHCDTIPP